MMLQQVKVWDPLIRIFHWSLVLSFVVAYLSGEEESAIHIQAGYAVLGLIVFRLIWGFIGPKYARFSQFTYGPSEVLCYIKGIATLSPKYYLGHNPLGAWMVITLLVMLFVVTLSGLKLYAVEEGLGPFAVKPEIELIFSAYADSDEHDDDRNKRDGYDNKGEGDEEFWEEIHEASSEFLVFLIFLHIAGVLASSLLHDEKLVKAMITGKKTVKDE